MPQASGADSANKIPMDLNCFSCKLDKNREKLYSFQVEGECVKRNELYLNDKHILRELPVKLTWLDLFIFSAHQTFFF